HVLRAQVQQARSVGIDGFITSWKDTPVLDRRLQLLLSIAASEQFHVGVVYQSLDFARHPLPIATVRAGMTYLVQRWGSSLRLPPFQRPVIIWTGTDEYSVADVRSVRAALGDRAYLLAASKSVSGYQRVAGIVDGEAYYWSSADPRSRATPAKLDQLSREVHKDGGIWFAPAAPGFDGRTLAHTRVIPRDGGSTFRLSLEDAYASRPDAVGVISWNEWSENTYIEPGRRYGTQELTVLRDYLRTAAAGGRGAAPPGGTQAHGPSGFWSGFRAAVVLLVVCVVGLVLLLVLPYRGGRRASRSSRSEQDRELSNTRD
ncbi:MAG TPA: endo-1,3-alpha-glucanase family glycosylhydrolase, partial [Jatrophihabitans sp.]|nr:endo-1,3-alpha-glucanase family glycosylhydrolase [Jatrophihabitans sp.]